MKLSLSVRVGENFRNKRVVDIALADLARMARQAGFQALCMRASVVGVHSPPERVREVRTLLDELGLAVSMVTGDFAVPENGAEGPGGLRHITPYLDLAEALGSDLIRVCMKEQADIPWAQRAADEARERHIRLAHQSHTRSLFETVQGSLEVLRTLDRPNFGLIYEPANLALCGEDYGPEALRALAPFLFNVYLQNHVPDSTGDIPMETWTRGRIMTTLRPLDAPEGIDFVRVFEALKGIGYDGYVTSHQAFTSGIQPQEATKRYAAFLQALIEA
jgi:sugar phosphate isomerase/epimerase